MESWVVSAEDLVEEQRTDPSLAWLVPQQGFWSDEEVSTKLPSCLISFSIFSPFSSTHLHLPFHITSLISLGNHQTLKQVLVQTPKKNFTVANLSEFFLAYDEPNFAMMVEVCLNKYLVSYFLFFCKIFLRTQKICFKGCHLQRLKYFVPMGVRLVERL